MAKNGRVEALDRTLNGVMAELRILRDRHRRAHGLFDRLGAAEPAAGAAGQVTPLLAQAPGSLLGHGHRDFHALPPFNDARRQELVGRVDNPLRQAETEREILEVGRRSHHDHVWLPVIR